MYSLQFVQPMALSHASQRQIFVQFRPQYSSGQSSTEQQHTCTHVHVCTCTAYNTYSDGHKDKRKSLWPPQYNTIQYKIILQWFVWRPHHVYYDTVITTTTTTSWQTDWHTDRPRYSVGDNRRSAQWRSQILLMWDSNPGRSVECERSNCWANQSLDILLFVHEAIYQSIRVQILLL